jgi:hypothetical protein
MAGSISNSNQESKTVILNSLLLRPLLVEYAVAIPPNVVTFKVMHMLMTTMHSCLALITTLNILQAISIKLSSKEMTDLCSVIPF